MNYHNILHCNMNNGPGLRVVLFVSGCSHHCKFCQNPQTWNENSGINFDKMALIEILDELDNDYCSGITLTGGDPLFEKNREQILNICSIIKKMYPTKSILIYTGYEYEQLLELNDETITNILNLTDILIDGEFEIEKISPDKHWVGSSNQRVIDLNETRKKGEIVLWKSE